MNKRIAILFVALLVLPVMAMAGNELRVAELNKEAEKLVENRKQAEQVIVNIDRRLNQIGGAIMELTRQDQQIAEAEAKKEVKKEKVKK